jgi:hypothetical protein
LSDQEKTKILSTVSTECVTFSHYSKIFKNPKS